MKSEPSDENMPRRAASRQSIEWRCEIPEGVGEVTAASQDSESMACYDTFMNNLGRADLTTLGMLPLALFQVMCADEQGTVTSSDLQRLATFIGLAAEQPHLAPAITAVGADLPNILKTLQMLNAVDYPDRLCDASIVLFQLPPPMSNSYKKSLIDFANDLVSKPRTPRQEAVLRSVLQTFL